MKLKKAVLGIVLILFAELAVNVALAQTATRPITAKDLLHKEIYPVVRPELLRQCQEQLTTQCLADIAWALVREKDISSIELPQRFAMVAQWQRTDELLSRIPQSESFSKQLANIYVSAERLARALSEGHVSGLQRERDQMVVARAANRLLGYLSDDRGRRINHGFGDYGGTLKVSSSIARTLLERWERLIAERAPYGLIKNPDYGRAGLGEKWLILGENERARVVIDTAIARGGTCDSKLIDLWLRLNAPARALELIKNYEPTARGYCTFYIAKWYKMQGDVPLAVAAAADAGEDLLVAKKYDKLVEVVELLADLNRTDLARQLATRAEQVGWNDIMSVFNVSTAGEMFGRAGDLNECQRLQAKALGVQTIPGEVVDWSRLPNRASWEGGIFDLGKALTDQVVVRRIGCGDRSALAYIRYRVLSQNYCDLYKRGRISPTDMTNIPSTRDDDAPPWLLSNKAAECHFELGENTMALPLFEQLRRHAAASMDYGAAHSAAELACLFTSEDLCKSTLRTAGQALIRSVSERKVSAYSVIGFAETWQKWGPREYDSGE
jgi:tetratricopeptide (TPR) repeat protein